MLNRIYYLIYANNKINYVFRILSIIIKGGGRFWGEIILAENVQVLHKHSKCLVVMVIEKIVMSISMKRLFWSAIFLIYPHPATVSHL